MGKSKRKIGPSSAHSTYSRGITEGSSVYPADLTGQELLDKPCHSNTATQSYNTFPGSQGNAFTHDGAGKDIGVGNPFVSPHGLLAGSDFGKFKIATSTSVCLSNPVTLRIDALTAPAGCRGVISRPAHSVFDISAHSHDDGDQHHHQKQKEFRMHVVSSWLTHSSVKTEDLFFRIVTLATAVISVIVFAMAYGPSSNDLLMGPVFPESQFRIQAGTAITGPTSSHRIGAAVSSHSPFLTCLLLILSTFDTTSNGGHFIRAVAAKEMQILPSERPCEEQKGASSMPKRVLAVSFAGMKQGRRNRAVHSVDYVDRTLWGEGTDGTALDDPLGADGSSILGGGASAAVASSRSIGSFSTLPLSTSHRTTHRSHPPLISGNTKAHEHLRQPPSQKKAAVGFQSAMEPIKYGGGPLMVKGVNVYLIFYGSWGPGVTIVENFVRSLTNSSTTPLGSASVRRWWGINTLYSQYDGRKVSPIVRLRKVIYDRYSQGTYMAEDASGVWNVIVRQFRIGALPVDPNGVYLVLTSKDVFLGDAQQGFCRKRGYCGWHSIFSYGSTAIKFGHVGNAIAQCGYGCLRSFRRPSTPNGNAGIDGMISIVGHELAEAATNPDTATGWMDENGEENADKCSRQYGEVRELEFPRGKAIWNTAGQGGMKWLLQQNFNPLTQSCVSQGPLT